MKSHGYGFFSRSILFVTLFSLMESVSADALPIVTLARPEQKHVAPVEGVEHDAEGVLSWREGWLPKGLILEQQTENAGADLDVWARIHRGSELPRLHGDVVTYWKNWYAARPEYMASTIERARPYLYYIVETIAQHGLPLDLALLPFIESSYNAQAQSPAKAVGLWQFIPSTGKSFELEQNILLDKRKHVVPSTVAAAKYLSELHVKFGDWQLALAAYNSGEGTVMRALGNNRKQGLPLDYSSLRLPQETMDYLPKLQAVKDLLFESLQFIHAGNRVSNQPYFEEVEIKRDIDMHLAAQFAGLSLAEFKALNPSFHYPIILGASRLPILLPVQNAQKFQRNLAQHEGQLASWTAVLVQKKQKIEELARHLKLNPQTLRRINNIPQGKKILPGSTVLIPRHHKHKHDIPHALLAGADIKWVAEKPRRKPGKARVQKKALTTNVARQTLKKSRKVQSSFIRNPYKIKSKH